MRFKDYLDGCLAVLAGLSPIYIILLCLGFTVGDMAFWAARTVIAFCIFLSPTIPIAGIQWLMRQTKTRRSSRPSRYS